MGGAPSLAALPDGGAAECETPRQDPVNVAPEPAAKTPWPGAEDAGDEDEENEENEEEEEGDAFGAELGETHGEPLDICSMA